jgi:hypothetical protein
VLTAPHPAVWRATGPGRVSRRAMTNFGIVVSKIAGRELDNHWGEKRPQAVFVVSFFDRAPSNDHCRRLTIDKTADSLARSSGRWGFVGEVTAYSERLFAT